MNKTILFGGSGFFGPIILQKYPQIISVGRTLPPTYCENKHVSLPSVDDFSILDDLEFDKVIFGIGNSNHHVLNQTQLMRAMEYNVFPLMKMLNYLKKRKIKKLICLSAALLYDPQKITLPVDESQPISPYRNNYLFSKYISEEITKLFNDCVPTIFVRISNIYGPTKLVRPDLVPTLVQQILSPDPATVWSKKPKRDFLYTPDAADAIVKLLATDHMGLINLGTGECHCVGEISRILEILSGKEIKDLNKAVSGPMEFYFDTTLVHKLTGWQPKYTLEQGITETYQQMKLWAKECKWWEINGNEEVLSCQK